MTAVEAGIKTFLIADVRGYTRFTQQRGDEAAARLATRFAELAREAIEEAGGTLVELRGDEALAVFDSARQALRAASDLQERFVAETVAGPTLPLAVGIGLDAGEAVPVAGGYRGGALNLAARLCSLAGPGEVLATETVLSVARTVEGIRYGERRVERVKGLEKPVVAVEILAADSVAPRLSAARLKRSIKRTVRSRGVRIAAVAIAVAAVVAMGLLVVTSDAGATEVGSKSVGFISPSGKVVDQVQTGSIGPAVRAGDKVWFANIEDKVLEPIDVKTRKV